MEIQTVEKPADWPRNNGEANLELVLRTVDKFKKDPSYKNKELLLSLIDVTDPNEFDERGLVVYSEYESAVINKLYLDAMLLGCQSLKLYLYGYVARKAREYKFIRRFGIIPDSSSIYIKEFLGLASTIKLFYFAYAHFNIEKEKEFVEYLIELVKDIFYKGDEAAKLNICHDFTMLLHDLSFANSSSVFPYLSFTREQIKLLFQLCAQLNKTVGNKVNDRPLRGTLKIATRQWILKSRGYDCGFVYKSISIKNILSAYSNNQIWMSEISKLNDKREQKVIKELFAQKSWLKYDWARKIKIDELKNSFVCSFSTVAPADEMKKKYGSVILGYKSDRIASLLAPTLKLRTRPFFNQVSWYNVVYSRDVAKNEINFLCEIINEFDLSDDEKASFFEDILTYWYLSFKDKKWSSENERRYQIFTSDDEEYVESVIEDGFFKMKSSLYTYPDFILTDDAIVKRRALIYRKDKTNGLMTQDYYFCNNCLQTCRFISWQEKIQVCPICGSENLTYYKRS